MTSPDHDDVSAEVVRLLHAAGVHPPQASKLERVPQRPTPHWRASSLVIAAAVAVVLAGIAFPLLTANDGDHPDWPASTWHATEVSHTTGDSTAQMASRLKREATVGRASIPPASPAYIGRTWSWSRDTPNRVKRLIWTTESTSTQLRWSTSSWPSQKLGSTDETQEVETTAPAVDLPTEPEVLYETLTREPACEEEAACFITRFAEVALRGPICPVTLFAFWTAIESHSSSFSPGHAVDRFDREVDVISTPHKSGVTSLFIDPKKGEILGIERLAPSGELMAFELAAD